MLPIYIYGCSVLREEATELTPDYPGLSKLIQDMFDSMYESDGVGLAAPQIGKSLRLFVVDADPMKDEHPNSEGFKRVFINPEIVKHGEETIEMTEGCLSLPGIYEKVERPKEVWVKYYDEHFQLQEEHLTDFNARVFQHEFDHIQQVLFTDRIRPMRKQMVKRKLQKLSKGEVKASYPVVVGK